MPEPRKQWVTPTVRKFDPGLYRDDVPQRRWTIDMDTGEARYIER
jgi:hypothetical protein